MAICVPHMASTSAPESSIEVMPSSNDTCRARSLRTPLIPALRIMKTLLPVESSPSTSHISFSFES